MEKSKIINKNDKVTCKMKSHTRAILFLSTLSFSILLFTFSFSTPAHASLALESTQATGPGSLTKGLVGYWTFNNQDMNWTTGKVLDRSGNGNDGQMIGMSTTTSTVGGKMGQGLKFNGSNAIQVDNQITNGASALTVSLWEKETVGHHNADAFIGKMRSSASCVQGTSAGFISWVINKGSSDKFTFCIANSANTVDSISTTNAYTDTGKWHLLTATFDGAYIILYVDGVIASTPVAATSTIQNSSSYDVCINALSSSLPSCSLNSLARTLDDVRIYNRALSAAEIRQLYLLGQQTLEATVPAGRLGTLNAATSTNSNGLVGYWTFNNQDLNWKTGLVLNKSGLGTNATLALMSTTTSPAPGKLGQALSFNGSQYVFALPYFAVNSPKVVTVSAWVRAKSSALLSHAGAIISQTRATANGFGGYIIWKDTSNKFNFGASDGSTSNVVQSTLAYSDTKWHLVTGVYDGVNIYLYVDGISAKAPVAMAGLTLTTTRNICIGVSSGGGGTCDGGTASYGFLGYIDDARIYNRALLPAEIKQLYIQGQQTFEATVPAGRPGSLNAASSTNSGGLAGYWTFNNQDMNWKTGTVTDRSGNGNTGQIVGMSTSTSPVRGKMGQALKFNGSSLYVNISTAPTLVSPFSASLWFYPKKLGVSQGLISTRQSLPGTAVYYTSGDVIEIDSYSAGTFRAFCNKTFTSSDMNKWWHVVVIINSTTDASQWKCYLNGVSGNLNPNSTGTYANPGNTNWTLGTVKNSSYWLNGLLDDVRVFSRALTPAEVKQLYNLGR